MTVFVPAVEVSPFARGAVANVIMRPDHLGAEQVGYITPEAEPPRLDMMGGELCVNACRAMGALLLEEGRLPLTAPPADTLLPESAEGSVHGADWRYGLLASSGVDTPVVVRARQRKNAHDEAAVCLRLPHRPKADQLEPGIRCVRLPGIVHLVIDASLHPFPEFPDDWRTASAALRRRFNLEAEDAVGCLWLYAHEALPRLVPTVWVQATDVPQLETACGSGTLACAVCLLNDATPTGSPATGAQTVRVAQYGGSILDVSCGNGPHGNWQAWVGGDVYAVARGTTFIDSMPVPTDSFPELARPELARKDLDGRLAHG